ncbi:MAG: hypothetical protein IJC43_03645 [Clostridia bacterium]|nr:hypothetical protein [Clostridia bacterium]
MRRLKKLPTGIKVCAAILLLVALSHGWGVLRFHSILRRIERCDAERVAVFLTFDGQERKTGELTTVAEREQLLSLRTELRFRDLDNKPAVYTPEDVRCSVTILGPGLPGDPVDFQVAPNPEHTFFRDGDGAVLEFTNAAPLQDFLAARAANAAAASDAPDTPDDPDAADEGGRIPA